MAEIVVNPAWKCRFGPVVLLRLTVWLSGAPKAKAGPLRRLVRLHSYPDTHLLAAATARVRIFSLST
jgi:hypothetical protein